MLTDLADFIQLIEQGSAHLAALCRLCDDEMRAVESQSAEALQQAVNAKKDALRGLAANTDARNQWLMQHDLSSDQEGIDNLRTQLNDTQLSRFNQAWQHLVDSLRKAAELNQRNEQIVNRSQKNLEQILSILRGHTAKTTIYDQAGLRNYSARGTLGKA